MKKKWPVIARRIIILSFLVWITPSCQKAVRPPVLPRYHFVKNNVLKYHLKLDTDASANLAIFQYNGKIGIDTEVDLKMLRDKTPYGMEIQMLMRNLKIDSGEPRLKAGLLLAMNMVRTYFSKLYLWPDGRLNVLYHNKANFSLSSYASMLFPDFSNENLLERDTSFETNFDVVINKKKYKAVFENQKSAASFQNNILSLPSQITVRLFDTKSFKNTVDPEAIATITLSLETLFDTKSGEIKSENGNISISMQYQLKQGFLSYNLSLSAKGTVSIEKIEEPQS